MSIDGASRPLVSQNVFVDNDASSKGGALSISVLMTEQGATVANNTVVGNRAPLGSNGTVAQTAVTYPTSDFPRSVEGAT